MKLVYNTSLREGESVDLKLNPRELDLVQVNVISITFRQLFCFEA